MESSRSFNTAVSAILCLSLALPNPIQPAAEAQPWKRVVQGAACAGAGAVGWHYGDKLADVYIKKANIPPAQAEKTKKAFKIGTALALCGVGAVVAGTTYSRLSKRGEAARKDALKSATDESRPATYRDPERPTLEGHLVPQELTHEGKKECMVVDETLTDGGQSDAAMIKYCRIPGQDWKVDLA